MALEKAIYQHTKDEVTPRTYAIRAPAGVEKPYIVFNVVSISSVHAMGGDSGLTETRVQFSVYGDGYGEVKGVIENLKSAYRNYIEGNQETKMGADEEGIGGHWVQSTLIANEVDMYENDTGLYHTLLDVFFWHMEVV